MLKKLFLKFLNGLSPDEKAEIRGLLEDDGSAEEEVETTETKEETKVEENGESSKDETKEDSTENQEANKVEEDSKEGEEKADSVEETNVETTEETTEPIQEETTTEQDAEVHEIALDDLVTKDYLNEIISGLASRQEATEKENTDLKNKVSEYKEKYETNDFGGMQTKVQTENKETRETFDSYSSQFD